MHGPPRHGFKRSEGGLPALRCAKQPHGDELAGLVISAIVRECTTGVVEHNVQVCGRPFIEDSHNMAIQQKMTMIPPDEDRRRTKFLLIRGRMR